MPASGTTITSLSIEISASADKASNSLDSLKTSIEGLKTVTSQGTLNLQTYATN